MDLRMAVSRDPHKGRLVALDERTLEREGGRELAGLGAEVRTDRHNCRNRNARSPGELGLSLLHVGALSAAQEREGERPDQESGQGEDEERSPDDARAPPTAQPT